MLARESQLFSREIPPAIRILLSKEAMQLVVNGETRDVGDAKSVRDVVVRLGLTEGPVAVELNREIVPRAEHESRSVNEGDVLEIVHFVGGG